MTTLISCFTPRLTAAARLLLSGAVVWLAYAPVASALCVGDCDGDGSVAINELVLGVNIALDVQVPSACVAFQDENGMVGISQLIKGVNNALDGCSGAVTPTPVSTPTPTGTTGAAVCGNHVIEHGETCDDGNTVDGDNCPANCIIRGCTTSTSMLDVDVLVQPPVDVLPGALQVFVRYPDGVVELPSSGGAASVAIINLPDDAFSTSVNDLDYGVRVVSVGPDGLTLGTAPPNRFFTAEFTLCQGATTPTTSDFRCTVENATAVDGHDVTATTTCSVALP